MPNVDSCSSFESILARAVPILQRPVPRMRRQIFQFGRCSLLFNCICEQSEEITTCQKVINGVIKEISDDPWKCCLCSFNRPQMCRFFFFQDLSALEIQSSLSIWIKVQETEAQPWCNLWQENYLKCYTQVGKPQEITENVSSPVFLGHLFGKRNLNFKFSL